MPVAVVGRGVETRVATEFLEELPVSSGVLLLSGDPGIGKTTLWTAVVERAHRSAFRVLCARPAEVEAKVAFAALGDLMSTVGDDVLDALPAPQHRALAVALLREDPEGHRHDHRSILAATLSVLVRLARSTPVLVAVDDVQWLDGPSARALEYAVRRLADVPVGVVACQRVGGVMAMPIDLERLVPEQRFTKLSLGPLDDGALSEIIESRLGGPPSRRALAQLRTVSGGNPFFALELARSLSLEDRAGGSALLLPRSLRDLVDRRLATLPPRTLRALLVASALRLPTVDLVAFGMRASSATARSALELAETVGVVTVDRDSAVVSFSHPLFAAGVYEGASPADQRRVHRRVAKTEAAV